MKQLFCDCKADEEKANFFLSGRGVETGVVAPAISNDVAMAYHRCAEFQKEIDALRAKVTEMEQQEPVAWAATDETKTVVEALGMNQSRRFDSPLFLAADAQPAPSVPGATWLPVPDKHPTFDPVDLQLADGSVLCWCVPQSDGDYWWEGPSGEVFIDPRYAPVTHWRLSAAPEAKP